MQFGDLAASVICCSSDPAAPAFCCCCGDLLLQRSCYLAASAILCKTKHVLQTPSSGYGPRILDCRASAADTILRIRILDLKAFATATVLRVRIFDCKASATDTVRRVQILYIFAMKFPLRYVYPPQCCSKSVL